jgi:hypothetical protein
VPPVFATILRLAAEGTPDREHRPLSADASPTPFRAVLCHIGEALAAGKNRAEDAAGFSPF